MIENDKVKSLLDKVKEAIPMTDEGNKQDYNIFSVLEVETKEVIMCRMLADLLNPEGQHGCGDVFLRSFIEKVIRPHDKSITDNIIPHLRVTKEYRIDNSSNAPDEEKNDDRSSKGDKSNEKRIDIVLHGAGRFIPIEVKINADEEENQCWDYYQYAKNIDLDAKVYYLTKLGEKPSSYSKFMEEGCKDKCCKISFSKDIVTWLEYNIKNVSECKMEYVLYQYLMSIKYFTDAGCEEMEETYANELLRCDLADISIGIKIARSFNAIQDKLIVELFKKIDADFPAKLGVVKLHNNAYDSHAYVKDGIHWEKIDNGFFESVWSDKGKYGSQKPFTCFQMKEKAYFLCIHIHTRIWADLLNSDGKRIGNWIYLPTGSSVTPPSSGEDIIIPDYGKLNDAAIALHDSKKMDEFIDESIKVIKAKLLERISQDV